MTTKTETYNKDELLAPKWLNADFLAKALQQFYKDADIVVKSIKFSPASVKGDHYASIMFRAAVEYQQHGVVKTKSLIIKTMPEAEGEKKEMFEESFIFETEIGMYAVVMPKFHEILRAAGDDTVLCANCVYASLSPRKVIIFEDIVPLGYTVIRNRTVNLEEAKAVLLKLAKWHAISFKLIREDPQFFDQYRHSSMQNTKITDEMKDGITNFIALLDKMPTLQKYKPYFDAKKPHLLSNSIEIFKEYRENPQKNAYYVLCHGDFHSKNVMFKHAANSEKLDDVLLLDFQQNYVGSIANDVNYAIYMMFGPEQRLNHVDELLYYYFSNFVATLQKIGFEQKLPKFAQFKQQLMQHKDFELLLFTTFLPVWIGFSSGKAEPHLIMTSAEYRKTWFDNPDFIKEVEILLPRFLHNGYFEHN